MKSVLVTGGAGFIGSSFVEAAIERGHRVVVLDALTYAGSLENLKGAGASGRMEFVQGRIQDEELVSRLLRESNVDWVVNFAAESHVDKSISGPAPFIDTNVNGTFRMLSAAKARYDGLSGAKRDGFRYLQISTDEVYGTLGEHGKFSEETSYRPNSPYSASKAAGDLLARAWFHTYGLPVITTNCSNNYGPRQFPEKLIPHMILCALAGRPLPVYGKGENVRDWIHVRDHAEGILLALEKGRPGETYCFGGNAEHTNLSVVRTICAELDRIRPLSSGDSYETLIQFVADRPGHDFRYAIDDAKAARELGYRRRYSSFEAGLKDTVAWYLANGDWCAKVAARPGVTIQYDWSVIR